MGFISYYLMRVEKVVEGLFELGNKPNFETGVMVRGSSPPAGMAENGLAMQQLAEAP